LIRNLGAVPVNSPFDVSFAYGGNIVTETINAAIAAGGTFTYTFSGAYPIVPTGFTYDFKSWVSLASDDNHLNDTAYKTVKYINNDAISSLPLSEGFESLPAAIFTHPEMAMAITSDSIFHPAPKRAGQDLL
jgi:hypothetical protein